MSGLKIIVLNVLEREPKRVVFPDRRSTTALSKAVRKGATVKAANAPETMSMDILRLIRECVKLRLVGK